MALTIWKLIAAVITAGYLVAAAVLAPNIAMALILAMIALGALGLIWFPEFFGGSWTDRKKTCIGTYDERATPLNRPTRDSHPVMVSLMGWVFLVGLPPLVYYLAR